MTSLLKMYKAFLFRYPIASQAIQTGILMGTGDIIAQTVVEKCPIQKLNTTRTAQFFTLGTVFVGPALRVWYGILHKHVGSGGKGSTIKKVAMDQLIFAPICLASVMTTIKTLQGNTFAEIEEFLKKDYCDVLLANYKIWPMVQLMNFYFVPLQYQVLLVQSVALFWNSYISYKTRPEAKCIK